MLHRVFMALAKISGGRCPVMFKTMSHTKCLKSVLAAAQPGPITFASAAIGRHKLTLSASAQGQQQPAVEDASLQQPISHRRRRRRVQQQQDVEQVAPEQHLVPEQLQLPQQDPLLQQQRQREQIAELVEDDSSVPAAGPKQKSSKSRNRPQADGTNNSHSLPARDISSPSAASSTAYAALRAAEAASTQANQTSLLLSDDSSTGSDSDEASPPGHTESYDGTYGFVYRTSDEVIAAINRITRFLDFRERCASEVMTKLQSLGYSRDLSRQVLQALQEAGIQSDARFAEGYVRSYWRSKALSPTRLAYELRSRGISQEHIDAALTTAFGDTKQLPRSEPGSTAEEESWEHLVDVCRRKAELTKGQPVQKRRAKLAGWMQRQGHTMSTVFRMFEALGIN